MRVLDLFSGIGGFSLGLERAGMRTVAFCENDAYPRAVLAARWPGVPIYPDVCELTAARLAADGIDVDLICGGFPCQDLSVAGSGAGLAGERSGLWFEYSRLIGEIRPRYVIVENVAALLARGLGTILGELAALGYDAEWHCIPASAVGAPHRRDRIWIVAHAVSDELRDESGRRGWASRADAPQPSDDGQAESVADPAQLPEREPPVEAHAEPACRPARNELGYGREDLADAGSARLEGPGDEQGATSYPRPRQPLLGREGFGREWEPEPNVGRVAHGVPARAHRLKALGNAVVPQIPEMIGRAILEHERKRRADY